MTSAIHWIKLYKLRSTISSVSEDCAIPSHSLTGRHVSYRARVYSVNRQRLPNAEVDDLLNQLDDWKDALPVNEYSKTPDNMPMISYDRFMRTFHLVSTTLARGSKLSELISVS